MLHTGKPQSEVWPLLAILLVAIAGALVAYILSPQESNELDEVFYPMIDATGIPLTKPQVEAKLRVLQEDLDLRVLDESGASVHACYRVANPSSKRINAVIGFFHSGKSTVKVDDCIVPVNPQFRYVPQSECSSFFGGATKWQTFKLALGPMQTRKFEIVYKAPAVMYGTLFGGAYSTWFDTNEDERKKFVGLISDIVLEYPRACSGYGWENSSGYRDLRLYLSDEMKQRLDLDALSPTPDHPSIPQSQYHWRFKLGEGPAVSATCRSKLPSDRMLNVLQDFFSRHPEDPVLATEIVKELEKRGRSEKERLSIYRTCVLSASHPLTIARTGTHDSWGTDVYYARVSGDLLKGYKHLGMRNEAIAVAPKVIAIMEELASRLPHRFDSERDGDSTYLRNERREVTQRRSRIFAEVLSLAKGCN